ncbi:restriction endonuclease subunit S [Methanosarcina sp. MSH10X1]|uniref:restriction endonuclease subunit S n=1 Tax=Methanosarcina sp. MSH10X1 TaxID=2507075 RepID=UPI000FFC935A|nr:restriction endonuclease subunit S [Methanosarcina sp. MSH10X1]RXA20844.1 restriction endonuclease subunit S [Methanosarcina sp. MSH10X1]
MASETKFKETEIGMIPEDWDLKEIGEIAEFRQGLQIAKSQRKSEFLDNSHPLLKITDMGTNNFSEYIVDPPIKYVTSKEDIIFTRTGQVGLVYTNLVGVLHNNCFKIITNPGQIDRYFLFYFLKSKYVQNFVNGCLASSVQSDLTHRQFKRCHMIIPPLEEQQSIGNTLFLIDQKIDLNRQMNSTLEQIAQTLFKRWFIEFEFPDENGNPYKSSGGRMVDSELGEIPEGWEVKRISDICETFGGGTPKTSEPSYWEGGDVFWATPTDMTSLNSPVIFYTSRKITERGLQNSSAKLLPVGSILMTSRATLGYFAITKVPISTNQGFISMVCNDRVSNYYLLNAVKNNMEEIENLAGGSTFLEINKTSFRSIKIILPPKNIMSKFDEIADSVYEKIFHNGLETKRIAEIRDSLLPKLMSGKIRVQT